MSGILSSIFASGFDKIITAVGSVFDELFTSKEEKAQAQLARLTVMLQAEQIKAQTALELEKAYIDDQKSLRDQITVEVQSQDWFVRRARPAVIWMGIMMVVWNYMLTPFVQTVFQLWHHEPVAVSLIDVPTEVWTIWGLLMGGISVLRSMDKRTLAGVIENGNAKGIILDEKPK